MRAIITDIRAGKAAALAEDGTVHLVDAKNRAVGQEIRIPAKRRRRWKKPLTWAACVAVLCGMATTGVYAAYEPYASVSIVGARHPRFRQGAAAGRQNSAVCTH